MILTLTSRKGGCGKSVLAMTLAAAMAGEGVDVGLLDADPNTSVHRWATSTYTGPPLSPYAEADAERLADQLPGLAARYGLVLVDTAGFGNQAALVAAAGADLVLVPATPGEGDLIEAQRTVGYVDGLGRSTRRTIPARVVANRIRRGTTLSRHLLAELDELHLPRLRTTLSEAVGYGEISFSGTLPRDGTPAEEIAALVAELRAGGWLPAAPRKSVKPNTRKAVKS